jgi:PAS domain S-box-containing protein
VINQVEQPDLDTKEETDSLPSSPLGRILVVDDEPELKNILVEALSAQGFEVTGCSSGEQALAELRQKEFDLLLTDLMMPEMDGIALMEAVHRIDPYLMGIMMTGQGTIQTAVDAMKVGAFDYVLKPFRLQTVMPVLMRAMNTRRLRMENLQLRETLAIYGLCQTISFTLDLEKVLNQLADAALQQTEADEVSILVPSSDGQELVVAAVRGEKRERLLGERVPLKQGISSWVARERVPLILNGEVQDERFEALFPRAEISSAVSIPMLVANKLVGIINLNVTNRFRPFTLGQIKALTILASTAAAALESASLYNQVEQAEKNYRSIFENTVEGIFQSTLDKRFVTVNPPLAHILGYDSPEEVVNSFTNIDEQLFVDQAVPAKITETLAERGVLRGLEFEAYRKDSAKIWLSLNLREVRDCEGARVCREGTIEDITERKRAEAERLVMFEIIQGVITTRNLNELFRLIHKSIGKVLSAENCFVGLYDETTKLMHFEYMADQFDPAPPPHPPGKGFGSYVLRTNRPLLLTDELRKKMYSSGEVERSGRTSASWLGVPLRMGSRAIGVLVVQHYQDKNAYTQRDLEFLSSVGDQIALAIERKQADESQRESEARKRAILESSMDCIITMDLEGRVVDWNPAAEKTFGYSQQEAIGKQMAKLIVPERFREQHYKGLARYLATGEGRVLGQRLELSANRRDGSEFPIELTITRIESKGLPMFTGYLRDITDRKRAERRLSAQYAVTRALAESNTLSEGASKILQAVCESLNWEYGALWTVDVRSNVLRCSQVWQATGAEADEFETASLQSVFPLGMGLPGKVWNDSDPVWIADVGKEELEPRSISAAKVGLHSCCAFPIRFRDEILGVVEFFSRSIREPDPDLLHMMTTIGSQIGQFIQRRRVEEALGASEEQLRQSQKLEAIGQLAGGVAHDFNNLLTVIGGYSSMLLGKLPEDSPHRSSLEEIKKASDRASGLTRQLLAFSRKQILQPKVLDLNVVVNDLEKMVRRLIGEDIDLLAITSPVLGKVKADPGQIEQVLLNLIVNARDAMPKGGKLTIETRNVVHSEEYAQRHLTTPGPYVMLAVSDTGSGIDPAIQQRIFEPFFTTKGSGKGTGLGLATVYGIVKQSGGNIWIYSEIGQGSTFKVYLPRVDEASGGEENLGSESVPKGSETLLLVEDEDQVRVILKRILEDQGYQVLAASNGEEALAYSQDLDHDIKLMITDVVMPQMSGRELTERIMVVRPNLRVLYMSGYTDDAIVRHGLLDESLQFIQKPFDSASVARKVREMLDLPL